MAPFHTRRVQTDNSSEFASHFDAFCAKHGLTHFFNYPRHPAAIIHSHHEYYDGSGFPDGLKGDEIPIEAWIIAVADVYDAMASDRPYRSRLTDHEIREELIRYSDLLFDPEVVEAFIKSTLKEPQ